MKQELTREEIAKVFFMHYGCEYRYSNEWGKFKCTVDYININLRSHVNIGAKLLLTPLSRISDEDASVVGKLNRAYPDIPITEQQSIDNAKEWLLSEHFPIGYESYQHLISKGYAVPLWFAPNHWANGKTAFELGIAIEKTN